MHSFFVITLLCTVMCAPACRKGAPPVPSKKEVMAQLRQCSTEFRQQLAVRLMSRLEAQKRVSKGAPLLQSTTSVNQLAERRYRDLLKKIFLMPEETYLREMRGALAPLAGCVAQSSCAILSQCAVELFESRYPAQAGLTDVTGAPPASIAPLVREPSGAGRRSPAEIEEVPLGALITLSSRKFDLRGRAPLLKVPKVRGVPGVLTVRRLQLSLSEPAGGRLRERPIASLEGYGGGHTGLLTGPAGELLVYTEKALLVFDRRGLPHVVYKPLRGTSIAAMATYGDHLLVAAEGSLIVLGNNFKEVGRVHLGLRQRRNNAHHILVEGGVAYLLDNRYMPILIFSVDLSNPRKPVILHRIETGGVYAHLPHQWYDLEAKRWGVILSTGGRCGTNQKVLVIDPSLPPSMARAQNVGGNPATPSHQAVKSTTWLYSANRCGVVQGAAARGRRWVAGTALSPYFAVLQEGRRFYMKRISIDGADRVSFTSGTELGELPPCPPGQGGQNASGASHASAGPVGIMATPGRAGTSAAAAPDYSCYRYSTPERALIDARGGWVVTHLMGNITWWRYGHGAVRKVTQHAVARPELLRIHAR